MTDTFNHWPQAIDIFDHVLGEVVRKAAFDIQAEAASRAPVDTGFLKNSIYVVTSESSDYGSGGGGSNLLPPVEPPPDDKTAYIAVGANYGIYQEFGTRYMPAHPYLGPAVEAVRPGFEAALGAVEQKMREAGL